MSGLEWEHVDLDGDGIQIIENGSPVGEESVPLLATFFSSDEDEIRQVWISWDALVELHEKLGVFLERGPDAIERARAASGG